MEDFILIADANCGIYCAQQFAQSIDFDAVLGIAEDDWKILLAGPNAPTGEQYFDIWHEQLEYVTVTMFDELHCVYEDQGGIWLYPCSKQGSIDWDAIQY